MRYKNSKEIFEKAKTLLPGGVNSPARAFGGVNCDPIFVATGDGSKIVDEDGNEYIDYIGSWGPLILGHNDPELMDGLAEAIEKGISFGLPTKIEVDMAQKMTESYPGLEMVRMVNSGTEATMSAIRLARGYTGRDKIIKFEGCYHGHSDSLLVKSGSGTLTFGVPTSLGVPEKIVSETIVCEYNNIEDVKKAFEENKGQIAGVILEPVAGNMGLVPAKESFLKELRELTKKEESLLIMDEVITGFRIAFGGAAEVYGITPDLVCFGKIIGGGMPVGAYGGSREIMEYISPVGGVYQAGTLSGNPLAMHLGLRSINILDRDRDEIYPKMIEKAKKLEEGFKKNIQETNIKAEVVRFKNMLTLFFAEGPFENYGDVEKSDTEMYGKYFKEMLDRGIVLPPAQFECIFISEAHTEEDLDKTIKANLEALKEIS